MAATAALVVAGTVTPAFAEATGTIAPTAAPVGGGNDIVYTTATANTFVSGNNYASRFIASTATCTATFGTTSTTNLAATTVFTTGTTATVTVPALTAGDYKLCIYGGGTAAIAGTSTLVASSTNNLTVSPATLNLSTFGGPLGGGNSITAVGTVANNPYLASAASSPAVIFRTTSCPATYPSAGTGTGIVATATKTTGVTANTSATITVPTTIADATAYNVCVYAGTTANTSALLGSAAGYAALPETTVSPQAGGTGLVSNITVSTNPAAIQTTTPAATFTKGSCPATYATAGGGPLASGTISKISNSKIVVPTVAGVALAGSDSTTAWNVCLYADSTNGALIARPGVYTVAAALGLGSATLSSSSGPAQGGQQLTVSGATGIPTDGGTLQASIGGSPLTNIKVISSTSFSGVTSAHTPGSSALSVTTAAGTKTGPAYSYTYGITVSPNTAPTNTAVWVDVLGVGFGSLTWGASAAKTGAHIYLADNDGFDLTDNSGAWTDPPVTECTDVIPISDTEVVCKLDLAKSFGAADALVSTPVTNGSYRIAVVSDAALAGTLVLGTDVSVLSSGATFTVAPF